jgi:hypothetical protein
MSKDDTAADRLYSPLQRAEFWSDLFFYVSVALSVAALVLNPNSFPTLYAWVQIAFIITASAGSGLGFASRVYFGPRAARYRQLDLLSDAFVVRLVPQQSSGYYNNDQKEPFRRLAACLLESSLYTSRIVARMLVFARSFGIGYAVICCIAALNRTTELPWLVLAAQVLLSEQVLSRWGRLEVLKHRSERTFDAQYQLLSLKSSFATPELRGRTIASLIEYEVAKAVGSIQLSSAAFRSLAAEIDEEWKDLRAKLSL